MNYGLQLYSVRDVTGTDIEKAIREVAAMGYSYVEFAGFGGKSAKEIRSYLDTYGIEISGTHSGVGELEEKNIDATLEYHTTIGNKNFIIPGASLGTRAELEKFYEIIEKAQPKLKDAGIALHYHNHSHEFIPTAEGYLIHDELQKHTNLLFEIDTFWAFNAGLDPIELLKKLKDRVKVIHLKDGKIDTHEGRSLGLGDAPVKAVREYAIENGLTMIVESESLSPDGLSEVRRCIDFLKALDKEENR